MREDFEDAMVATNGVSWICEQPPRRTDVVVRLAIVADELDKGISGRTFRNDWTPWDFLGDLFLYGELMQVDRRELEQD